VVRRQAGKFRPMFGYDGEEQLSGDGAKQQSNRGCRQMNFIDVRLE